MVVTTESKVLDGDSSDIFFSINANFFTKSFVVIMCAYLESYLKDVLMVVVDEMNDRLNETKIPHNLIKWSLSPDKKDLKGAKFENLNIAIRRTELDDFISGNPYRTENLFKNFGINLSENDIFKNQKERVNSIVGKRNSIIHHNDNASDISFGDITAHIDFFIEYTKNIDNLVANHIGR
jgi:hypothetical protein